MDIDQIKINTYESLLRNKKINVAGIYEAPFGYTGWKLFDLFMDNVAKKSLNSPSSFRCYLSPQSYKLQIDSPWNKISNYALPGYKQIYNGKGTVGGISVNYRLFEPDNYHLADSDCLPPLNQLPLSIDNYHAPVFPLNENEWDEFINQNMPKN